MRKIFVFASLFILFTAANCDDEALEGEFLTDQQAVCQVATTAKNDALIAFNNATSDNFSDLCNDLKDALQNQIMLCSDPNGLLQISFDELGDCNDNSVDMFLIGNWLLTAWTGENPIDLNNDGVDSVNFLDEIDCYTNQTIDFNIDNTGIVTSRSYAEIESIIEVGTTDQYDYTVNCIEELEITNITWSIDGNMVTAVSVVDNFELVFTLVGNQLSVLIPEGFIATDNMGTATTTEDITLVYTKQ